MITMVEPTSGIEAAEAVRRSRERLEQTRATAPKSTSVVKRLLSHLEVNHFSERLDDAFGRRDEGK